MRTAAATAALLPITALALLALLLPLAAGAAPKAELWERWTRHDPQSTLRVDHDAWDALLRAHVHPANDGIHRVDYRAFTGEAGQRLDDYLAALAGTPVSRLDRDQQRAYWINLYNALTVKVVAEHYPVESIRDIDISPGLFANGPWGAELVTVEGEALTLDDIEHRILRPIWKDPRIHYAVNCASLGCPNLMPQAFTADNAERLLDAGARDYVNHPRGARVADGELVVSSIYEWFTEDFGGDDAGVIEHLRQYAEPELATALAGVERIGDDHYDWGLNDVAR